MKMLGLAAVAALTVMAFAGATSAMAESTLLCENEHPSSTNCTAPTHFHFLSVNSEANADGKGKLLAGSNTVECNLLVLGELKSAALASPVEILADLTYTNCNLGCSVAAPAGGNPHGVINVLRQGTEELAAITGVGFEVQVSCPFIFTCDYNSAGGLTGHGLPGPGGKAHTTYTGATVNLVSKLSGPFNCPSTGALDALLQSLTPLYVTS